MLSLNLHKGYPVVSHFSTLAEIVKDDKRFNIPIYQRLYVWKDDQIKTLLEDLEKAFRNELPHYYLGGVILARTNQEAVTTPKKKQVEFDLIDGQQRFTTLWLIGSVLKHSLTAFNFYGEESKSKARLNFSIRDFANEFFNNPENRTNITAISSDAKAELKPISSALETINRFIKDKAFTETEKSSFSDFLMHNLRIMVTIMPHNTDENKLFEVSNNRGVQLQHHEILKPRLLKYIESSEERTKYAQVWDACAIMDNYLEKNIKEIAKLKWRDLTTSTRENEEEEEVSLPKDIIGRLNNLAINTPKHLIDILETPEDLVSGTKEDNSGYDVVYDAPENRSILSFPMLLLHVLRIFQFEKNTDLEQEQIAEIDEKKLLVIFEKYFTNYWNETDVKAFIELLWEVRLRFDKHVVKWVGQGRDERLTIEKLYRNKEALQRREPEKNSGFMMLQSMLYHSQETISRYWLTPLLNKMRSCDSTEELYRYLRNVDNAMFCAGNNETLRVRSWNLLKPGSEIKKADVQYLGLEAQKGTDYPSYVFYKLDFILWYFRDTIFDKKQLTKSQKEDWEDFRITSKNSVEHISPQNRNELDLNLVWELSDSPDAKHSKLDDFGNLVLLTSGMNSEYSNKIYTVKRSEFIAKAENHRLDSLKSALIFENERWSWDLCQSHREDMINYFKDYFSQN
ncbi:DUF262 domain-containing protein [Rufibacter hautae]|uniref:DUF262 domain-containing protein n=1 Tax=Rufibacter hautae TaxID=2595005 RepID=A0A5B6TEF1_9BACT|nr:DUF262 domain-containing protein [Rufibacter hautae]KAA3437665.1 DUF262 domain-containing protein [Rufibacter hautae]